MWVDLKRVPPCVPACAHPTPSHHPIPIPGLRFLLHFCHTIAPLTQALMVLLTKKAGLGAAYGFGYGFIIVKLKQTGCLAQWSAPLFFRTQFLSLGLTVGYVHTGLVQAAGQPSQLLHVLAPHKGAGPKVIVDRAWVMEYSDSAQQVCVLLYCIVLLECATCICYNILYTVQNHVLSM